MAKDLNKVMLTGYLGADPEMRYTPQGSAVTTFRVASGRSWKSSPPHRSTRRFSTGSGSTEWLGKKWPAMPRSAVAILPPKKSKNRPRPLPSSRRQDPDHDHQNQKP